MPLLAQKNLEVSGNPDRINCLTWKKQPGYLARLECTDTMKAMQLTYTWESRYPSPENFCGGGDKEQDPRCSVAAPGFDHPHVIMTDDHFYTLHIDMV